MVNRDLANFINSHQALFWSYPKSAYAQLSPDIVVETILNYGDTKSIKELFDILGIDFVADIFTKQSQKKRSNYLPQVSNFFKLYFAKHVSKYPKL